jgi:hypothetical protein
MNEEEITRRLTKIDQLMNQLIHALMQTGMTYRQAGGRSLRNAKEKEIVQGNQRRLRKAHTYLLPLEFSDCFTWLECGIMRQ